MNNPDPNVRAYGPGGLPIWARKAAPLVAAGVIGAFAVGYAIKPGTAAPPVVVEAAEVSTSFATVPTPAPTYTPTEDVPDPAVDAMVAEPVSPPASVTSPRKKAVPTPQAPRIDKSAEDEAACDTFENLLRVANMGDLLDETRLALRNPAMHKSLARAVQKLADRHQGTQKMRSALAEYADAEMTMASAPTLRTSHLGRTGDALDSVGAACRPFWDRRLDDSFDDVLGGGAQNL